MPAKKLYIQMFSIHGLLRSEALELGRNADTGGQINYVVELCRYLSQHEQVGKVDLFTRLISDKTVSEDYSKALEEVNEKFRIIRIQCGGYKYIRKELLWPHLDEYIDKTIKFIKRENAIADVVHGHYSDAGYVAMHISRFFGIPFVFTGHSLGRLKKQKLYNDGVRESEINKKYKIDHRIAVEEDLLKNAGLIVTSTNQEIKNQYGMYQNGNLPEFKVIPPGLNLEKFYPYYHDILPDSEKTEHEMYAQASILQELNRFFINPDKPLILALSRPDKRKNISGLIKAYGEDRELQAIANLAVFAGIRKDIEIMEENEKDVLANCRNGILMDPGNAKIIADSIKQILTNKGKWDQYSKNGIMNVRKYYTWKYHAQKYIEVVSQHIKAQHPSVAQKAESFSIGKQLAGINYFLVTDIDYTLIGGNNDQLQNLIKLLKKNRKSIGFGVATGRDVKSAVNFLQEHDVHSPDVIIASVGTEIYYGEKLQYEKGWETHISDQWNREKIFSLLKRFRFLEYQEESNQSRFKISYYMTPNKDRLAEIHELLSNNKCRYNLIYSGQKFLDILPYRASKGKAIRYLGYKWEIPVKNFMVCGDSGNDEEMLKGEPMAVVVGNYEEELEKLKGSKNVYFAEGNYAGGIL